MRVIVAVTAASGAIYARQVVELLLRDSNIEQIALIYSERAEEVMASEGEQITPNERIVKFANSDMFATVASGSAAWESMIIVPCSAGTMGRIASGVSDSLITRAADVMLKERRRLVLVLRESPLSLIHLRNMTSLTEAGAILMPASPNYYGTADSIESIALTVSSRAVTMAGADGAVEAWRGKPCRV